MSLKIDRAELEIVIKNDTSRKRMREIEDDMRRIRKEMKGLDEKSPQFAGKMAELKKAQAEYDKLVDKIGLTGLSMKELRRRQQELNAILAKVPGNSPLYDKYKKQLDEVNGRLKELRGNASDTESSLSKMANGFNKYFNMGITFIATITGASMAFKKMAEDVAVLDDVYSDVMKTTGMTREQVLELNKEFKKMDTRTSREDLNKLAAVAGKLGIQGKEDILGFVTAGNQINVALGEDLGEDAIKSIGKLTQIFSRSTKELNDLDLEGKMLAIGSAINSLGQSSTADESYLVEFAKRVSGAFSQANISIQDTLGYAAGLDQSAQNLEMSATAVQQFMMKVLTEPAKFAKIAGVPLKEFNKLLKEDTNDAMLTVLKSMSEKGGFQQLIPIFDQMGLDGARAVGVLSSLATNINLVTEAQALANKSFSEGTSITIEYSTKNNNLAARLDKVKKNFKETQYELGEKLNPILLTSTNYITYLTKGLIVLINHWATVSKILLILVAYWAAYNGKIILNNLLLKEGIGLKIKDLLLKTKDAVVLQALIIQEAARAAMIGKTTIATKAAALAQVLWNTAIKANPLGLFLGIITSVAAGIWLLTSRTKEVSQTQKSTMNIQEQVNKQLGDQEAKVRVLISILNNEKIALSERKKALEELKTIVPGYHGQLTNEGVLINNNTTAIKEYLAELQKEIHMQAAKDELIELGTLRRKQQQEVDKYKKIDFRRIETTKDPAIRETLKKLQEEAKKAEAALNKTLLAIAAIDKEMSSIKLSSKGPKEGERKEMGGVWHTFKGGIWVPDKTTSTPDEANNEKIKELDRQLANETVKLYESFTTKEKYEEDLLQLTLKYLAKKRNLYKKDSAEYADYQTKIKDIELKKQQTANELVLASIRSSNETILNSLQIYEQEKRREIQQSYDDELDDQNTYNSKLAALEIVLAQKRLDNAKDFFEIIEDANFDSEEEKKKAVEDASKAIIAADTALLDANAKSLKLKKDQEKEHLKEVEKIRKELGLDKEVLSYKEGLKALKAKLKEAEATEKETADAVTKYKLSKVAEYANTASKVASQVFNAVSGFERAALAKTESKYQQQIESAKRAGQDTTAIEEEKEKELAKVRAKYADAKFTVQIAQIGAETAHAAIIGYKEGLALGSPILGGIYAAAATLYGFSQIAIAKSERDAAKAGYKSGGFTGGTSPDEVRGYFADGSPYHGGEFVANHKAVRNPHVRKFLNVFDSAQLNGTIHMLNTTQILERVRTESVSSGYKSGGYTASNSNDSTVNNELLISVISRLSMATEKLNQNIDDGIVTKAVISGKDGVYEQTQRYLKYIKNASRG